MLITQSNGSITATSEYVFTLGLAGIHLLLKTLNSVQTGIKYNYIDATTLTSTFLLDIDGWYSLHELILPISTVVDLVPVVTDVLPENVFYLFEKKVYRNGVEQTITQIITSLYNESGTNLEPTPLSEIIVIDKLNEYYINIVKTLINQAITCCSKITSASIIKRDTLTMGIALIKQLAYTNRPSEAARYIDIMLNCIGIDKINCGCNG